MTARNTVTEERLAEIVERAATLAAERVLAQASLAPQAPPKRFLATPEAADYLSLSTQTLELWRTVGRGPAYTKLQKGVRYDVRDLDAFMAGAGDAAVRKVGGSSDAE